jgi:hypothetical protein
MGIIEKIKEFFGLGTITFDTWSSDDYGKIENILTDMGGRFVKEYGTPTVIEGKKYKVNGYRIEIELWDYNSLRLCGKKEIIEEVRVRFEATHDHP